MVDLHEFPSSHLPLSANNLGEDVLESFLNVLYKLFKGLGVNISDARTCRLPLPASAYCPGCLPHFWLTTKADRKCNCHIHLSGLVSALPLVHGLMALTEEYMTQSSSTFVKKLLRQTAVHPYRSGLRVQS